MFLSILSSHQGERDFLYSLPKKLMIGLVTLFISVASMMVSFSASFFVLYRKKLKWVPILIPIFAFVPIIIFVVLQLPLLSDMFRSMYDSRYLFKPRRCILYYVALLHRRPPSPRRGPAERSVVVDLQNPPPAVDLQKPAATVACRNRRHCRLQKPPVVVVCRNPSARSGLLVPSVSYPAQPPPPPHCSRFPTFLHRSPFLLAVYPPQILQILAVFREIWHLIMEMEGVTEFSMSNVDFWPRKRSELAGKLFFRRLR
ncbi:hypothetical protein OSB04_012195 [Centaurea solstitialis]|uniref:Uncharacterized protein n=1 Tax=Centaurea solstitialis TaxID=347529 RepID=A0AA38TNZ0_9ASTR|nr:hypothetical protein OSB04_012195 [Centaurea solstitialis]